ncbi:MULTISPECIES: hypothetical protein [unclassified Undibacterium]|nr:MULTISPECIES: hypothetical protein [unclassified Undibacterium]MEB0140920.1 hypothetical protein [Undibacterium sp. CCC2.1]MEB0173896.1 hypothetical protein [Undibacterium sp. CCC1.1]MEB0177891.1 hypothetical protein [Undibacterium sp. CCC3.4]MEB0217095.1 hypothetical protein [Undibacterium sp. 5I2]WPX42130.1 hypothetical protein RHM61_12025 [Undibacterium sp. CCC3.4]
MTTPLLYISEQIDSERRAYAAPILVQLGNEKTDGKSSTLGADSSSNS